MGKHAIVIGASISGLLAAFGAAEGFERVTIVERDELVDGPTLRKGVPQGRQPHALLTIGRKMLAEFIPDLRQQLIGEGCPAIDEILEVPYWSPEGWRVRYPGPVETIACRRPLFEWVVRRNLMVLPNVDFRFGAVEGLTASGDTVTGVRLQDGSVIEGDLVVDASGRGSKSPRWMEELGYEAPKEVHVRAYQGYSTQQVRMPEGVLPEGVKGIAAMPHPGNTSGAFLFPADNGVYMLMGAGMMKNYPPKDREALLDYIDTAPSPLVGQFARQTEPISDVVTYRVNSNQLRLWHRMEHRPEGFVVTGDAVASYNPIYGQGMSQAAQGGIAMRDAIRNESGDSRPFPVRFQEGLAKFTDLAFAQSAMADAFYEGAEVEGMDPPDTSEMDFFTYLEQLSTEDPEVLDELVRATYSMEAERLDNEELKAKVQAWIDAGRTVTNNDPTRLPGVVQTAGV
ncbi:NAD(P)/FAD-dependent oxidoreductase [Mycobacterium aquaticum]|uniref:FAD-binding domain-containing protein n=1 Tax=Mycobacterium aquaticum TaxID=1927124 RepID=A0A1W9ZUM4_9MYCO|nr:FAD-dependent oxidoreductase [Mycobacterium aquaticum]ORA21482.1 hypothetical protein BST13_37555 [Mycobacterium aquaticum]